MAAALYDPSRGYYARGTRQVGREGDFYTSVSAGPLFGVLLARRFLQEWTTLGNPGKWRILECGAHDGTLAHDILGEIARQNSAAFAALEYAIPEPLPSLRDAQRRTLADFPGTFVSIANPAELTALPGIVFGNELLDALPFHLIERRDGRWLERRVALAANDSLAWTLAEITDPALQSKLPGNLPEGYLAEVRTNFPAFLEPLVRTLTTGLLLWADYGFARPELYDPARRDGTLRTFSRHRASADPLDRPGEIDITAHVDFTAAAEAAIALGCVPTGFRGQGPWLTEIARDWLLAQEGNPDPALIRNFQTLTHPAHLGGNFHILELSWNHPAELSEDVRHRLALQACPPPPNL